MSIDKTKRKDAVWLSTPPLPLQGEVMPLAACS